MALISLNPMSTYDMCCRIAKNENVYVLVIDNRHYHTLSADKKAEVYNYYKDPIDDDFANWIIPEAEIDAVFEAKDLFYVFKSEQAAVDNCCDWFPQEENLPDADHFISAYVIKPNGTIPYTNKNTTAPA
jgi:hypothetical protein